MPSTINPHYGTTEGLLGFPLTDRQAIALDAILKALPKDDAQRGEPRNETCGFRIGSRRRWPPSAWALRRSGITRRSVCAPGKMLLSLAD
jgi:hypothetical protein